MIKVPSPIPEPATFNLECRQEGAKWLRKQKILPARPKDLWSPFRPDLRQGFGCRCGYLAMWMHDGAVDHFISWHSCKTTNPGLAYEWTNFRFIDPSLNSKKRTKDGDLLDPFEVEDGWFEVLIPSFVLKITDRLPSHLLAKATTTLEDLDLQQGRKTVALRWEWYEEFRLGRLAFDGLKKMAPLVANAVEAWQTAGKGPLPAVPRPVS